MATIEGKGLVPPKPVAVRIEASALNYLKGVAERRSRHRGYEASSSSWRRGSTENPILVGLVGEYAFQEFLRSRGIRASVVDEALNNGDGGRDALIAGVSYQVKTSGKAYKTCLVRRVSESKRIVPHVCDRFVFCRWSYGELSCDLRGWCGREKVVELGRLKKSKTGASWFNNELDEIHFSSMANLALLIKQELSGV